MNDENSNILMSKIGVLLVRVAIARGEKMDFDEYKECQALVGRIGNE